MKRQLPRQHQRGLMPVHRAERRNALEIPLVRRMGGKAEFPYVLAGVGRKACLLGQPGCLPRAGWRSAPIT